MDLESRIKKYKNRFRLLVIKTPDYKNNKYLEWKNIYQSNQKVFHKYYLKLLVSKSKQYRKSSLKLYGFDGSIKKSYSILDISKIIKDIESMPMGQHIKPTSQSLFVDYNPKTTIQGLGYKDKEKALETITKIKNQPITYQKQVLNTMIGRANHHPNQTSGMKEAIQIFQRYQTKLSAKTATK